MMEMAVALGGTESEQIFPARPISVTGGINKDIGPNLLQHSRKSPNLHKGMFETSKAKVHDVRNHWRVPPSVSLIAKVKQKQLIWLAYSV